MSNKQILRLKLLTASFLSLGCSFVDNIGETASYNTTVNPAVTTLADGDSVNTTNQNGIVDTSVSSPGIQLGANGSITVNSSYNQSDLTTGTRAALNLKNNTINHLGTNSSISAIYTDASYSGSNKALYGIYLDSTADLEANKLTVNVTNQSTGAVNTINTLYGIQSFSNVNLGTGSSITVNSSSTSNATGMIVAKSLKADNLNIEVTATNATGLMIGTNATVDLGSGSSITSIARSNGYGINMNSGSSLSANNLSLSVKAAPSISSIIGSASFYMTSNTTATVGANSSIYTEVKDAAGLYLFGGNSSFTVTDQLTITTKGANSQGAWAQGTNAVINLGTNAKITTYGNSTYSASNISNWNSAAVMARDAGKVVAGDNSYLKTYGNNFAMGVFSYGSSSLVELGNNVTVETYGKDTYGLLAMNGNSSITAKSNLTIISHGDNSTGLLSQNNATINLGTRANIQIYGENSYGTDLYNTGKLSADGLSLFTDKKSSIALQAAENGTVVLTGTSRATTINAAQGKGEAIQLSNSASLTGTGIINILGNVSNADTSNINVAMDTGSSFLGSWNTATTATGNLSLTGSYWKMTGDSLVPSLSSTNSTIEFGTDISHITGSNQTFGTLSVDSLSGNNTIFKMRTDMANQNGDLLMVTGSSSGTHQVFITNQGSAQVTGDERLTVVKTSDGIAEFQATHIVELGGYQYTLHRNPDQMNDWELFGTKSPYNPTPDGPSNPADAGLNLFRGSYLLNYAENQTLMKRLGDLRNQEQKRKGDLWARVIGGKFSVNSDGFLHSFDMDYWGLQAGLDKKIDRKDGKGTVYVGGMFGYSKGNLNYDQGSGNIDSKYLGAYWTHISPNGFYADFVLKYGWQGSEFNVLDSAGQPVKGKNIDTQVFSGSLELGRKYFFNQTEKKGFYVEPQTQLTIGHQSGETFTASNGLQTKVDGYRSVLGRVGAHIGYEVKSGKNPVNVYAKWDWVKEFDGDLNYSLNNSQEETSYKGSWHVWGVGATAQFGKKHNLYLEVERATGGKFVQDWAISGGYRFSW